MESLMCEFEEESQMVSPGSVFSTPGSGGMSWHRERAAAVAAVAGAVQEITGERAEVEVEQAQDVQTSQGPQMPPGWSTDDDFSWVTPSHLGNWIAQV